MFSRCCVVLCGIFLSSCQSLVVGAVESALAELKPGQYQLDPTHTTVIFKVQHLGLSTYVGRFNQADASLNFDPANMSAATLDARVSTASIDANNSELENTLRNRSWLDCDRSPNAQFVTQSVRPIDKQQFEFSGLLTLRGVVKPATLRATFHGAAQNRLTGFYTLGFSATGTIKRSDYGIDRYLGLVGDEVTLEIYAEFQRVK